MAKWLCPEWALVRGRPANLGTDLLRRFPSASFLLRYHRFYGRAQTRPDLQKLLDDIRARKIDVIVVYKVDRLTRSLADFAKLVELFDTHGVSFVLVTQQFNTTTSMGRLTLNVLLSFAQFEREVTSERIRDKIAASKRKGLWVGGTLPLGYEMKDGKIAIVEEEAELVRSIFRRYLELGTVNELLRDLKERNIRTKTRQLSTGATRGGIPFGRGALYYLLSNHFYVGDSSSTRGAASTALENPASVGLSNSARIGISMRNRRRTRTMTCVASSELPPR